MRSRNALKAVGSRWSSMLPLSSSACMGLWPAAAREPLAAWEPGMALTAGGKCGLHSNATALDPGASGAGLWFCLVDRAWQASYHPAHDTCQAGNTKQGTLDLKANDQGVEFPPEACQEDSRVAG